MFSAWHGRHGLKGRILGSIPTLLRPVSWPHHSSCHLCWFCHSQCYLSGLGRRGWWWRPAQAVRESGWRNQILLHSTTTTAVPRSKWGRAGFWPPINVTEGMFHQQISAYNHPHFQWHTLEPFLALSVLVPISDHKWFENGSAACQVVWPS